MDAVPSLTARLRRAVVAAAVDAGVFLFPVACAGCGADDVPLCDACRAVLASPSPRVSAGPGALPVCSAFGFEGIPARVIRALKNDGRTHLARALAPALAAAVARVADAASPGPGAGLGAGAGVGPDAGVGEGGIDGPDAGAGPYGVEVDGGGGVDVDGVGEAVLVVPVPSSRAAMRRRGFRVVDLIAARGGLAPVRALRLVRATADQRGLSVGLRAANVAGSMRARGVAGCRVVVVDDVVTSGATLGEAARALRAAGARVCGAATVAATRRHGPSVAMRPDDPPRSDGTMPPPASA